MRNSPILSVPNTFQIALVAFILCVSMFASASSSYLNSDTQPPLVFNDFSLFKGADKERTKATYFSKDWQEFESYLRKTDYKEIYWISWETNISEVQQPSFDLEMFVSIVGSFEFYVDDVAIYQNGLVSSVPETEKPGNIQTSYLVPKELLTSGTHTMAFKISSHHREAGQQVIRELRLQAYNPENKHTSLGSLIPSLALSIAFIIGVYFLTIYLSNPARHWMLIFSVLCFDLFVYGISIEWKYLAGYTYDWHYYMEVTSALSGILFSVLLPAFFLAKYRLFKWWPILLLMPVVAYSGKYLLGIELKTGFIWTIGLSFSLIIMAAIVFKRRGENWWELLGLLICLLGIIYNWNDVENFFLIFPILVFFILLTNVIQAQREHHNGMVVKVKASQLEAQLLRRNIQPHFILNSLASIIELIETAPEKSIDFISALADEFRLFAEIANKSSISINDEIALCENHLAIMGFRYQRHYTLEVSGLDLDEMIPTGILHTLMENAFTHNDYSGKDYQFQLIKSNIDGKCHILFKSAIVKLTKNRFGRLNTGTSSYFIESQLKQSCKNQWHYKCKQQGDFWVSEIIFKIARL